MLDFLGYCEPWRSVGARSVGLAAMVVLSVLLGGCTTADGPDPNEVSPDATQGDIDDDSTDGVVTIPNDDESNSLQDEAVGLLYVLQMDHIRIDDLGRHPFEWLVIEPSRSGDVASELTWEEVDSIRTGSSCGKKKILAYLSIGEAEYYRDYFDAAWVEGESGPPAADVAPAWLGPSNPDFPSNYKVRYWDEGWQDLILGSNSDADVTPLDRIINSGYDGVYLDIVDAYDFWSSVDGGYELTRSEARRRMIELIVLVSSYARETRDRPDFLVFPQNAADIIRDDDGELDELSETYFRAVSGIGIEDLFYDELSPQPEDEIQYSVEQLGEFISREKVVLVTDYVIADSDDAGSAIRVGQLYRRASELGCIPYAAKRDRDLDEIVLLDATRDGADQPATECIAD